MVEKKYLLIQQNSRDTCLTWLTWPEVQALLLSEESGIDRFFSTQASDVGYWREGDALLMRVEILTPQPVVGFVLPAEQKEPEPVMRRAVRFEATHDKQEWLSSVGRPLTTAPLSDHPERLCHRCDRPFVHWSAPSPLWNKVVRGDDINGTETFQVLCQVCFVDLAEEQGVARNWRMYAVDHDPLTLSTPSGRVWNELSWKWEHPPTGVRAAPVVSVSPLTDAD